jgi:copper resistance protein B
MRRIATIAGAALALHAAGARAQMSGGQASEAAPFGPPVEDRRVWAHLLVDQFEARIGDSASLRWDAEAWSGSDAWRVRLRSEGVRAAGGRIEDGQDELLLSKPITTFWDAQLGARYDLDSRPERTWAAIGVEGLAPGFFDVAASAYFGEKGAAAKLKVSYDQLLTNRLILQPEAEMNLYSGDDRSRRIGAGISDLDAGLRLRYEITRKFAPYIGVAWEKKFGQTAAMLRADHERTDAVRFAVGVRAWY